MHHDSDELNVAEGAMDIQVTCVGDYCMIRIFGHKYHE